MIDETADTATSPATRNNISDAELNEYRAFKESKIREASLAEGQQMATAQHLADEAAADAAALQKLTSKNLSLKDAFGRLSTDRGRGLIVNLHRSQFGTNSAYSRLRRLAVAAGLVQ
jgi:hypothetical protein